MVADIQLLQGKIIDDPEKRSQNVAALIDELAREFVTVQEIAVEETAVQESKETLMAGNS